jgi:adenylate kinase
VRLILMGAPGSGKGTQAKILGERINVPHISSGDILRDAIRRNTALGAKAKTYMDRGELVPDDVLLGVMEERLQRSDCHEGFILDGFPRTLHQAETLNAMLASHAADLDHVLWLQVPSAELVRRLSGRRTCKECGASYHLSFDPPKKSGVCDRCGGQLVQREDDREETIVARLKVYERQTAPLAQFYRAKSLLSEIDGVGASDEVLERMVAEVKGSA